MVEFGGEARGLEGLFCAEGCRAGSRGGFEVGELAFWHGDCFIIIIILGLCMCSVVVYVKKWWRENLEIFFRRAKTGPILYRSSTRLEWALVFTCTEYLGCEG